MQQQPGNKKKTDILNIEKPPEIDEPSEVGTSVSIAWTQTNEKIAVEWCDIAKCYKWLHTRAHQDYSKKHAWFTIPAIIKKIIPKIIYGNKNRNHDSFDHPNLHSKLRINAHIKINSMFNI